MKSSKRVISLILFAIFMVSMVVSLSSCNLFGPKECTHTFEEAWTTDATNHWHKATCEHTEEKGELAAHVDADSNKKCDVCDYAMSTGNNAGNTGNNGTNTTPSTTNVVYTVTVKNAAGEAIVGAMVKLVNASNNYVNPKPTNADGVVTFTLENKDTWKALLSVIPEGYAGDVSTEYEFTENAVTIVLNAQ